MEKEDATFTALVNYFTPEKGMPSYDSDRVHELIRTWLNARLARIVDRQAFLFDMIEDLQNPQLIKAIDKRTKPSEILTILTPLLGLEVHSEGELTIGFLCFLFALMNELTNAPDADRSKKISQYADILKSSREALRADPFQVAERFAFLREFSRRQQKRSTQRKKR
jgi:hypothetical protein